MFCHNAGSLVADESYCDNLDYHVLRSSIELTSVFPNVGVIGRNLKTGREDLLSVKAVLFAITQSALLGYAVKCWVRNFIRESITLFIAQEKCSNPEFLIPRCVLPEYRMCASWLIQW